MHPTLGPYSKSVSPLNFSLSQVCLWSLEAPRPNHGTAHGPPRCPQLRGVPVQRLVLHWPQWPHSALGPCGCCAQDAARHGALRAGPMVDSGPDGPALFLNDNQRCGLLLLPSGAGPLHTYRMRSHGHPCLPHWPTHVGHVSVAVFGQAVLCRSALCPCRLVYTAVDFYRMQAAHSLASRDQYFLWMGMLAYGGQLPSAPSFPTPPLLAMSGGLYYVIGVLRVPFSHGCGKQPQPPPLAGHSGCCLLQPSFSATWRPGCCSSPSLALASH